MQVDERGRRCVAHADGHVEYVSDPELRILAAEQGIDLSGIDSPPPNP